MRRFFRLLLVLLVYLLLPGTAVSQPPPTLTLPTGVTSILDDIYSGHGDLAIPEIRLLQQRAPQDPLGYLLEAEVEWWKIWCLSAEFKYGMTMARHHNKAPGDAHYLELTTKAYELATAALHERDTGQMHLYAGMADALAARLHSMKAEYRAAARAGVRARENFQAALALDPNLADAYTGLGLYNYYVDTLSMLAKTLRFLMGIPGGTKEEGIRQLRLGMAQGQISASLARFYLALNLFNYDQRYEDALNVITPLTEKYPRNAIFLLMRGDLNAKLGRKPLAEASYRAAQTAATGISEPECQAKIKELAVQSLAALQHQ